MRVKLLLIVAALIVTATMAQAQPNVPTLTVDTLVDLSKAVSAGLSSGALFLPDGNIVTIWNDTPLILDSKSGNVLRTLEKSPIETVPDPYLEVSKDGSKLLTRAMGPKLAVWDIPTGKISFPIGKPISYFCLSHDGTKFYVTLPNKTDNPGIIAVYDMNTFQEIERLSYPNLTWGGHIDISPDGQILAIEVGKEKNGQTDTQTNQLILINLNDKQNYTVIETMVPRFMSIQFSPDGKQIASLYNDDNTKLYIYIYNLDLKEKKYIRKEELSELFGGANIDGIGTPQFIDNEIIYTGIGAIQSSYNYNFTWNISEQRVKNLINFPFSYVDVNDSLVLYCGGKILGLAGKSVVHVTDKQIQGENYLRYQNNQLEYDSDYSFIGESMVFDTTGKQIANLGTKAFIAGKNIIQVNQQLPLGIYIFTIKSDKEQISKKFLVE